MRHAVTVKKIQHVLLEHYRYEPGPAATSEPHAHAEYQISLSFDFPGVYEYRGGRVPVPVRSVTVLHPGEPHAVSDPGPREQHAHFAMLYLDEAWVRRVAAEWKRLRGSIVFTPVSCGRELLAELTAIHERLMHETQRLAQDALARRVVHALLERQGFEAEERLVDDPRAVRIARDYLHRHAFDEVSLDRLAFIAGVSAFHLTRLFVRHAGFPPHRYQLQLRVARARELLALGVPIGEAALQTGFVDQSHLHRQFKRYAGVPPGRYRRAS